MHPSIICSHSSLQVNEPLPGTAPHGQVWMLLEYDGLWGKKAFEESKLPQPVKSYLHNLLEQIPSSKLLLIRQHVARKVVRQAGRLAIDHKRQGIRFFLALAMEQKPLLYDFRLEKYEDLLDLDIVGAASRSESLEENLSSHALLLICTNGRRDWCCARYGTSIYQETLQLTEESDYPLAIWQSSHVGGHRFAPNIVSFPKGLFYGRINKSELQDFLNHIQHGHVYTAKARGRACYLAPVQAAEIFLRQDLGLSEIGEFHLIDAVESQPDRWLIRFKGLLTGGTHSLEILKVISSNQVFKSCNDRDAFPVVEYKLLAYKN
jgi:hypothetical protein